MAEPMNDGGPAFPSPEIRGADGTGICAPEYGMSLRDHFAGIALRSILSNVEPKLVDWMHDGHKGGRREATAAYAWADAMIAARTPSGMK